MRRSGVGLRLAVLLVAAAMVPLVALGGWALIGLQRSTRESVVSNSLDLTSRGADDIARSLNADVALLNALASDLQEPDVDASRETRVLANFATRFAQFREITILDEAGKAVATSAGGPPHATIPTVNSVIDSAAIEPVTFDRGTPSSQFAVRLSRGSGFTGWLAAEVSLEEPVRIVNQLTAGASGYALLVAPGGALISAGPRRRDADLLTLASHPLLGRDAAAQQYVNARGEQLLGVVARVPHVGWSLIVEQPVDEAFAATRRLQREFALFALAVLVIVLVAGLVIGRRFVEPLVALERATRALTDGDFRARVEVLGNDEFGRLAASFNAMADRLVRLQEDIKSQERQVMFGRIVAGLFHDISHPVQNIANNARLLLRNDVDGETRSSIQTTIERELVTLRRFLDDVLNVARPRPLEHFPIDVHAILSEVIEAMRAEADRSGITLSGRYGAGAAFIDGDRFALGRVYRNLLKNAVQATPPGGSIAVGTARLGNVIEIQVTDTGTGIPPDRLSAIFDDFVTTRRLGLGLGLATARRIVEQLGGTIAVSSEVGRGSTFTLRFPATSERLAGTA